ncbi:MAG: Rossmann-like and DUF2520 domain-containing protein [candidate division WOR-3 bacterium]
MASRVIIIGTGKLGSTLGYVLAQKNYQVYAYDRDRKKLKRFYQLIKKPLPKELPFKETKIIFITTQDQNIKEAYQEILPQLTKGSLVIHCSGVLASNILKPPRGRKIIPISLHPIQTFPKIITDHNPFSGIYFSLEGSKAARTIILKLINDLEANVIFLSPKDKPIYHLLLVIASNYLVSLMGAVKILGQKIRLPEKKLFRLLEPLVLSTWDNIKNLGLKNALSGPIERGDIATIQAHLKTLKKKAPELLPLYRVLGRETIKLATLPKQTKKILQDLLAG